VAEIQYLAPANKRTPAQGGAPIAKQGRRIQRISALWQHNHTGESSDGNGSHPWSIRFGQHYWISGKTSVPAVCMSWAGVGSVKHIFNCSDARSIHARTSHVAATRRERTEKAYGRTQNASPAGGGQSPD